MQTGRPSKRSRTAFGQRLLAAREAAGLSQAQLATKLGMSQPGYAAWERDPVALRPEQIEQLAAALDVPAEQLLGKAATKTRHTGPVGKARKIFAAISKLPRHQQEKIFSILEPFISQHSSGKAA